MSNVVRTDVPLSPSGTTIVRLDKKAKAELAEQAKYRPTACVARMRFDLEAACYNELKDNQIDLDSYCNARGLHPYTLQYIRQNREFATCPLRHVSKRLDSLFYATGLTADASGTGVTDGFVATVVDLISSCSSFRASTGLRCYRSSS